MQLWATIRSLLASRCCASSETIGDSVADSHAAGARSAERQIDLVHHLADQAVIAIENVRLFDEVQAQTRDLTEAII